MKLRGSNKMRIRCIFFLVVFMMLLLNACKGEETPSVEPSNQTATPVFTVSPTPVPEDTLSFREALESVSFSESSEGIGGYVAMSFENDEVTNLPERWVLHMEELGIHLKFKRTDQEVVDRLMKQMEVVGTSDYTLKPDDNDGTTVHLRVQMPGTPVTVKWGDVPALTVTRNKPLQVEISRKALKRPAVITETGINLRAAVKVSESERYLLLTFSEAMRTSHPKRHLPEGEWLDDRTFRLHLSDKAIPPDSSNEISSYPLGGFLSDSGNFIPQINPDAMIYLERVKERNWISMESNTRVGWSEQDFLYDYMTFSPDGSQYIGTAAVAYDNGHNMDHVHTMVLERKGE